MNNDVLLYFACPRFTETIVHSATKKHSHAIQNKKHLSTKRQLVACEEVGFVGGEEFKRTMSASNIYKVDRCLSRRKMSQFILSHAVAANVLQLGVVRL